MMAVAVTTTLFSCNKDEAKVAPTVTIKSDTGYVSNTATVVAGSTIRYGATIVSNDDKLKTVEVTASIGGAQASTVVTIATEAKTYNLDTTYSVGNTETTIVLTIKATDDNGESTSKSITLNVKKAAGAINQYTATLLGGQSNANTGSYYATASNSVYTQSTAPANSAAIDIIYYYGSNNKATLVAPSDATVGGGSGNLTLATILTKKNATQFAASGLTAAQFDAITDDAQITAITPSSPSTISKDLALDNVILFKTEAGKLGLIKVANLKTGDTGTITIDVKVQK